MKVANIKPAERLQSIVRSYMIVETAGPADTTVLPHLGLVLAIQLQGRVWLNEGERQESIAPLTVSGVRKTFRKFSYHANTRTVLIFFTESGAYSMFGEAVFELFEGKAALEELVGVSAAQALEERLYGAGSNRERIAVIEEFLVSKLAGVRPDPDKPVLAAVDKIYSANGLWRITELAKEMNMCQDIFEKRFRAVVGATPKQFANIVRMKGVIEHFGRHDSMMELVHGFGFYDQSHFIRQFKDFSGQTPGDFFKRPYIW